MSLTARPARAVATLWINPATGDEILPDGQGAALPPGPVTLSAALDSASRYKASRVMLAGAAIPPARWVLGNAPGWDLDYCNVMGSWWARYVHRATGEKVWVRTVQEWGAHWAELPLGQARAAFEGLSHLVATLDREHPDTGAEAAKNRAPVMLSPEATGLNLWALTVPGQVPVEPIAEDIAEQLRATVAPVRSDYVIQGPKTFDGYASPITAGDHLATPLHRLDLVLPELVVSSELGVGPAWRLTGREAADLMAATPYHPARYLVTFRVPANWAGPGIFGVELDGKWRWPNRPGFTGTTWTGQAEMRLALAHGWVTVDDIAEAVAFTHSIPSARGKGKPTRPRPLDGWARALRGLWEQAGHLEHAPTLQGAIARITTATLDAFSTPVERSTITDTRPANVAAPLALGDGRYAHQEAAVQRTAALRHPELTAQVRSNAAARILDGPSGGGGRIGALHLPGAFYGARGPAMVTDQRPEWAEPGAGVGRWNLTATSHPETAPASFMQATRT